VRGGALVFHAVAQRDGDFEKEIEPPLSVARLEGAVRYLVRRYILVKASELPSAAHARRPGRPLPIALTFDDDLASHRDLVAPLLRRHSAPATAFLCGTTEFFWWQGLQAAVDGRAIGADALPHVDDELVRAALDRRPLAIRELARRVEELSPAERDELIAALPAAPGVPAPLEPEAATELASGGWEIGFHTRRHDMLTRLGDDELDRALAREPDATGALPRSLAYPHGKAGVREADAARRAGYDVAYTGRPTPFGAGTDPHLIGRLQPATDTVGRFALQLARALAEP
jgi:peptidoglycan/xylan/chitin deacetylase (PgdA/CDA1 family)